MALQRKTFQTRAVTAILFAAVMLGGLLWNQWSFFVLFSIIHFGCWWEYLQLTEKIYQSRIHPAIKLGWMMIGYGFVVWMTGASFQVNGYSLQGNLSFPVSCAGFVMMLYGIFQRDAVRPKVMAMAAAGLLYISTSIGLMIDIFDFAQQQATNLTTTILPWLLPVAIIAAIWINDTMAYIVGSLIGKTPLSPISPKKTWEGTIGGILLSSAVGYLVPLAWNLPGLSPLQGLMIALAASVVGTLGDLFESKLKRKAGVKDSGSFLPGHGGFLDRFDSLLWAIPVAWLLLKPFLWR